MKIRIVLIPKSNIHSNDWVEKIKEMKFENNHEYFEFINQSKLTVIPVDRFIHSLNSKNEVLDDFIFTYITMP